MIKKIFLHIGFPKTASTSIQKTLTENSSLLLAKGYLYPKFEVICGNRKGQLINHSYPLITLFANNSKWFIINTFWTRGDDQQTFEIKNHFREQLDKVLSNKNHIIFSSEVLSNLSIPELETLKEFLSKYGEIKVLAFVRRPLAYLTSLNNQRIKAIGKIGELVFFNQSNKVISLKYVFGENLTLIPFKVACGHMYGPLGYLLEWIGIYDQIKLKTITINSSLSNEAIRLLKYINSKEPLFITNGVPKKISLSKLIVKGEYMNPSRLPSDIAPLKLLKGKNFQLRREEFLRFLPDLEKENEKLKSLLGSNYCDEIISLNARKNSIDDQYLEYTSEHIEYLAFLMPYLTPLIQKLIHSYFEESNKISSVIRQYAKSRLANDQELRSFLNKNPIIVQLKKLALSLEENNPSVCYYLLSIIRIIRPNNIEILAKLKELELQIYGMELEMPKPYNINLDDTKRTLLLSLAEKNKKHYTVISCILIKMVSDIDQDNSYLISKLKIYKGMLG